MKGNPSVTIMHPFPRVGEITKMSTVPGAAYFRQAKRGLGTHGFIGFGLGSAV